MHNDRPYAIPLYITKINVMSKTYDHDKLIEEPGLGIQGIYQDNGYYKVVLPEPIIENVDTSGFKYGIPFLGRPKAKQSTSPYRSKKVSVTGWERSRSPAAILTKHCL